VDQDGSGELTAEEVRQGLRQLFTPLETLRIMLFFDDGDGLIDANEFVKMLMPIGYYADQEEIQIISFYWT